MQIHELTELSDVSTLNNNHVLAIDTGTVTRRIKYNNIAKATIENYNGSTIGGKAQTVKSAINAIATALDGAEVRKAFSGSAIAAHDTSDDGIDSFRLYGKCVQDGTPTPANPVAIATAGSAESIAIVCAGKNLLQNNETSKTSNGVTFTVQADGSVTVNGTATATAQFTISSVTLSSGAFIFNGCPSGNVGAHAYMWDSTAGARPQNAAGTGASSDDVGSGANFTAVAGHSYAYNIRVFANQTVNNAVFKPMIRVASDSDQTYKPYTASTATLPTPNGLPGIPVTSGGNYIDANDQHWICDTIDKAAGVYIQRIRAKTITAFTSKSANTTIDQYLVSVSDMPAMTFEDYATTPEPVLCTHARACTRNEIFDSQVQDVVCGFDTTNVNSFRVTFNLSKGVDTLEKANALIADGMTLMYPLATPVVTPLTAAQRAALDGLRSFDGNTTIYTTDALEPEFTVKPFVNIGKYL